MTWKNYYTATVTNDTKSKENLKFETSNGGRTLTFIHSDVLNYAVHLFSFISKKKYINPVCQGRGMKFFSEIGSVWIEIQN